MADETDSKNNDNPMFSVARKKIQDSIEKAEKERKKKLQGIRIEIAKAGLLSFESKKTMEAAKHFHSYLRILEDLKGVPEHGLLPTHFDKNKEIAEILLVSGVYWDLAKLYDRTKSSERQKEFKIYLQKFVTFSKGMSFQPVCAETLRKYLSTQKPVHRDAFHNAYKQMSDGKCFIVSSLNEYTQPETLFVFRSFRDERLEKTVLGQWFIKCYYFLGPGIAQVIRLCPQPVQKHLARSLDRLAELIQ